MALDKNKTNAGNNGGEPPKKSATSKDATPIGDFLSIGDFVKHGMVEIMQGTKAINAFPQGQHRDVYCAQPDFGRIIDQQLDEVLAVISVPLKLENIKGNIERRAEDDQLDMLFDFNDTVLERINSNLDVMAGLRKGAETIEATGNENTKIVPKTTGSWNANLKQNKGSVARSLQLATVNIERPQFRFPVPVDNSADTPFIPKLKEKPNSLKPLAILPEYDEAGNVESYIHPYEFELMKFEVGNEQLKPRTPEKPPAMNATAYTYVDTVPKLKSALEELRKHKEIAIDVEHHSYRSFQGFTCLVQMSTREKDYLFDALVLREEMHILNEVLTDAKIVKIFHGAALDIEWLQRDLSLYIVNMFDTHQAAITLNFSRLSLAFLLKHYCNIEADKTFQLADWRVRPLPEPLVSYARQDTHFLIYIFESITNDLLNAGNQQSNLLRVVYERSTELCKKRYQKPSSILNSHMDLYRKSKRLFNNRQLYALSEIFHWRDVIARAEDESYGYVLPNHMLLQIAENLPREVQGIIACCNPLPTLVKRHLHAVHEIVLKARDQPLIQPIVEITTRNRLTNSDKIYNNKLYCPHDTLENVESEDHLPCLLDLEDSKNNVDQLQNREKVELSCAQLSLFSDASEEQQSSSHARVMPKVITPFQRYLAILPVVEKEKLAEAAQEAKNIRKRQLCPAEPTVTTEQAKDEVKDESMSDEPPAKRFKKEKAPEARQEQKTTPPAHGNVNPRKRRHSPETTIVTVDSDSAPEEMPSTSQASQQQQQNQQQNHNPHAGKRNKRQKQKRPKSASKTQQSSANEVQTNYNYQQVDFSKFKGGAQRAQGTQIKPQIHGRSNSNKAQNKKFNKLFTFSNVKGGKK